MANPLPIPHAGFIMDDAAPQAPSDQMLDAMQTEITTLGTEIERLAPEIERLARRVRLLSAVAEQVRGQIRAEHRAVEPRKIHHGG